MQPRLLRRVVRGCAFLLGQSLAESLAESLAKPLVKLFVFVACLASAPHVYADAAQLADAALPANAVQPADAAQHASAEERAVVDADGCVPLTPYAGEALEQFNGHLKFASERVKVGQINVVRLPVFDLNDPEQNRWLFRQATALRDWASLNTRPRVIEQTLFFKPGETVAVRTIAESERALRAQLFLYDARILPARRCADSVDFDVVTRDLWTLLPRLDIARSGGFSNIGFGMTDSNLFGTGKKLSFGYRKTVDRSGGDLSYDDPNVSGTHQTFGATVAKSDDGYLQSIRAGLPFYSLDTRFAWGATIERAKRDEPKYFRGKKFAEFERTTEFVNAFVGWSPGLIGDRQPRVRLGFVHEKNQFANIDGKVQPNPFPEDRVLDYPYIAVESVEDDYELTSNLDRLQRTEDLYTGQRTSALLGYSTQGANRYVFRVDYFDAEHFGERAIMRYAIVAEGRYRLDTKRYENLEVRSSVRLRDKQTDRLSLYASAGYIWTENLTEDRQLLLGGDTGLRGYPLRYQLGDRRFLFSLEERYVSDLYIAKIVRVGAAVFADVGRAWFPEAPSKDEFGMLADVGVGLRLESTRTTNGVLMHIDVAFPLVDGQDVDAAQFLISFKQSL